LLIRGASAGVARTASLFGGRPCRSAAHGPAPAVARSACLDRRKPDRSPRTAAAHHPRIRPPRVGQRLVRPGDNCATRGPPWSLPLVPRGWLLSQGGLSRPKDAIAGQEQNADNKTNQPLSLL